MRRCVGCGRRAPKADLRRFVADHGGLAADATATRPGRGAYVCANGKCMERALDRRAFQRALRAPVTVSSEFVESESR